MRLSDRVVEAGAWLLENGHRTVLKLTGGKWPRRVLGMEPVELHTIGRRTGQRHSTLLTAPICEPERVVLVASHGGHRNHPAWYLNLVAHPDVEVTVGGDVRRLRARTATGDERAELWQVVVRANEAYAGYQRRTEREIPVVVCEPIAPEP